MNSAKYIGVGIVSFIVTVTVARAVPPALDPVNDMFASGWTGFPATQTFVAVDSDPGDVVSFEIVDLQDELRGAARLKDVPRVQRFVARPTLQEIFAGYQDRRDRNARIRKAHVGHGYTMTEIAHHLKLHLMTIGRAVRKC